MKKDVLARFIYVVQPLIEVYKLPATSVNVFYDLAGQLIAFNRNASLFVNLRYFEAWRAYLFWRYEASHSYIPMQTTRKCGMETCPTLLSRGESQPLAHLVPTPSNLTMRAGISRWPTRSHTTSSNRTTLSTSFGSPPSAKSTCPRSSSCSRAPDSWTCRCSQPILLFNIAYILSYHSPTTRPWTFMT